MQLEVTGKLAVKYDTVQVSEKFKKREFVMELSEDINGQTYTNYGKFQAVQTRCEALDRFNVGDTIKVSFNIKGQSYVDKKDGSTKYISNLDSWKIELIQAGTSAPQQTAAPVSSEDLPF